MVSHAEQVRLRLDVLDRDAYSCITCGFYTCQVHHVIPLSKFGSKTKHLAWQEKNMAAQCQVCHEEAGSKEAMKRDLQRLEGLHNYDYSVQPWLGALGRAA